MTLAVKAEGSKSLSLKKSATGSVMIFKEPIDLLNLVDHNTGKVIGAGSEYQNKSIKNRIIIAPKFSYDPDLEFLIFLLAVNKNQPKAFVISRASSNLILGAVMADIPIIYGFDFDLLDFVKPEDRIKIDFEENIIRINP